MKYKGEKCFYCNEEFNDNDDVVVCPECGTPYHRDCYKQAGSCINHQLHESGESWKNTVDTDNKADKTESDNAENKNLSDEQTQTENNPFGFDLTKPFFGLDPNEDFEGATMGEIFTFVKTNTLYYIPLFKKMKDMGSKISFNLTSFLFPYFYFANRKMWFMALVSVFVMLLLQIPALLIGLSDNIAYGFLDESMVEYAQSVFHNLLVFIENNYHTIEACAWVCNIGIYVFRFAMCLFGNWLYYRFTIKSVNKLKLRCPDPQRRMSIISSTGGTSVLNIFLIALIFFAGYILLAFGIDVVSLLI